MRQNYENKKLDTDPASLIAARERLSFERQQLHTKRVSLAALVERLKAHFAEPMADLDRLRETPSARADRDRLRQDLETGQRDVERIDKRIIAIDNEIAAIERQFPDPRFVERHREQARRLHEIKVLERELEDLADVRAAGRLTRDQQQRELGLRQAIDTKRQDLEDYRAAVTRETTDRAQRDAEVPGRRADVIAKARVVYERVAALRIAVDGLETAGVKLQAVDEHSPLLALCVGQFSFQSVVGSGAYVGEGRSQVARWLYRAEQAGVEL